MATYAASYLVAFPSPHSSANYLAVVCSYHTAVGSPYTGARSPTHASAFPYTDAFPYPSPNDSPISSAVACAHASAISAA